MTLNNQARHSIISCPACGNSDYNIAEKCPGFVMLFCKVCGLCFADPMRGGADNFYKEHLVYRSTDNVTIKQHCTSAQKLSNRRLLAMLSQGGRVLDIGCGYGAFVYFAVQQGFDAYGIDFNDEHIRAGRSSLGLGERLLVGDIATFHPNKQHLQRFDLVTLFEVIEHIEKPKEMIQNVRLLLSEGGLLALSCPNEGRWQPTGRLFVDYPPHHLTRWRPETLQGFLEKEGFEHVITELDSSFCDLFWVAYVNRSASHKTARANAGRGAPSPTIRNAKLRAFNFLKLASKPCDSILRFAGVTTMGMRMIMRKA
jgi:2-polyprenyl-3-methyl-5-hydroxy-6-metoxy-1,4-benzoquinol methylase